LTGCAPEHQIEGLNFSPEDIAFLDELGDTIIPETDTPWGESNRIGAFMVMMVLDTYDAEQQKAFVDGLNLIRKDFKSTKGSDFVEASQEDRLAYLNGMNEQFKTSKEKKLKWSIC